MSCNSTHDEPKAHFTTNATKSPTRGILQKSYDYEAHETPEHKQVTHITQK